MAVNSIKCIAFLRVSTTHQTIDSQKEEVYQVIHRHGYSDDEILCIEQKESAIKLSTEDRISVQQLFNAIKQYKTIEFVFVYEISRLTRQSKMMYEIRDFLIEHHVNLHCMKPEFTLLDKDFKMSQTASILFSLFTSLSESEMMIKRERMMRGVEYKKKQGLYVGGKIPFGYTVVDKRLQIDEQQAMIVRRILNDYAHNNKSLRQIARELADEGVFKNRLNAHQTISNIISKRYYCGDFTHQQIIGESTYDAAQRRRDNKTYYKKYNDALCKGLLFDKKSGYRLTANNAGKQYYVRSYNCAKQVNNVSISFKAIHTIVCGLTNEWYDIIISTKRQEMIEYMNDEIARQQRIIATMQDNIIDNQDKIDRVTEMYIDGKYSREKADAKQKQIFNDLLSFKQKIASAENKIIELNEQLNDTKPNIMTMRDKVLYVIDKIIIDRLSRFVCEAVIINRWTGETRTYTYNTRTCDILSMSVTTRPTLYPPKDA